MASPTGAELLVAWETEESGQRRQESWLGAGVLHLSLAIAIFISPSVPARPAVATEPQVELTVLEFPPELLKQSEPEALTPEERKRMVIRGPLTVDPEELRRVSPPPPVVTPPVPPGLPLPPQPPGMPAPEPGAGGADRRAGSAPLARLENIPRPGSQPNPKLELPLSTPGRALEDWLRSGPRGGGAGDEPGLPLDPNFNTPYPTILSDTRGVDFGPYLARLVAKVRRNWYSVIPESARLGERGRVVIVFTILKGGDVPAGQPHVVRSSGVSHLDRPALAAIRASQPFAPLPAEFDGERIVLQFTFLYNLPIDYGGP